MEDVRTEGNGDVKRLMRSHGYFHGLSEDVLESIAAQLVVRQFATGDVVYQTGEPVTEIGFLAAGRLKGVISDSQGVERLLRFANRGEAVGMISAAMSEPLPIAAIAIEPSTLLMLDYGAALELTAKYPDLRKKWAQRVANRVRSELVGDTKPIKTSIVTVFRQGPRTNSLVQRLVDRLFSLGETIGVFSDREEYHVEAGIPIRRLQANGQWLSQGEIHEQIGAWDEATRIVIDVGASIDAGTASRLIGLSHRVLWLADETNYRDAIARLSALEAQTPAIRDKVAFVWDLGTIPQSPYIPELAEVCAHDFKVLTDKPDAAYGVAATNGFERLVHHLRGLCVGLALGGGAARGMAHLGVLRALEKHGIVIDRVAGTSVGAMTGLIYAAGHDPDYLVDRFAEELQPPWAFRNMPRGRYWYLAYMYRRGHFEPMLRKYLSDWRIEQLPIPSSAITIDLVSGDVVVRDSGDAAHAILDSINLPLLSKPILRGSQLLIDGGLVNNVPADVLVSQGCNFIIAVDVGAKIEKRFAGIDPEIPAGIKKRRPNSLQTLLRTYAVQAYHMNSVVMEPADIRIEPDTSAFSMAAFTKAAAIAEIGDQATTQQISKIATLLDQLDRRSNPRK
jgi:NTE family protein